jgi:hypothetical protein
LAGAARNSPRLLQWIFLRVRHRGFRGRDPTFVAAGNEYGPRMTPVAGAAAASPPNYFITLPRLPSICTGLLNRWSDAVWERRFNINTRGCVAPRHGDATRYESVPYHAMFRIMDHLQLGPDDVVVDIGSGMGRAVCVAASYPIRESIGVELEADLHRRALENAVRARRLRAPIRLHCRSAADFDFAHVTVILFFNPFGPETMRTVLRRIEGSLRAHPRTIRIGYLNATCAHVLCAQPWIAVDAWWEMTNWSRVKTPVHFYRANGTPAHLPAVCA